MNNQERQPEAKGSHPEAAMAITPDMLSIAPIRQDARIDFERNISYFSLLPICLICGCIATFGWQVATAAFDNEGIVRSGAAERSLVLGGEVWRLVTAMFLHANAEHLIGNCVMLYVVGMACEHAVGRMRTAMLYFCSGAGGFCLSIWRDSSPSIGASGAIFGLTGAVITFLFRNRAVLAARDKRTAILLLAWTVRQVINGFRVPCTDNFAHLGGMLVGVVGISLMLPRSNTGANR